jgi:membrane-bound ClpP family serine protease
VKLATPGKRGAKEDYMIVLGVILLILGLLLDIGILWTIGIIVLIVGIIFLVLGQMGRAVGGRKYWF